MNLPKLDSGTWFVFTIMEPNFCSKSYLARCCCYLNRDPSCQCFRRDLQFKANPVGVSAGCSEALTKALGLGALHEVDGLVGFLGKQGFKSDEVRDAIYLLIGGKP